MRFVIKILAVIFVFAGLFFIGWLVSRLISIFGGLPFLAVGFGVEWISSSRHDRVTKGICNCPACRKKMKFDKKAKKVKSDVLFDIPLFCKVFPEGIVGSCGFCWNGYCAVFEDGCVRWNELGDKKDYSVGRKNPFEGGE